MQSSRWQLHQFTGTIISPALAGACDVRQPGKGLGGLQISGHLIDHARILGPGFHLQPGSADRSVQEVFARGSDLAAIYAPAVSFPFRAQAYWRLESHPLIANGADAIAAIELVASTQTDLLDSRPDIVATSSMPVESAWQLLNGEAKLFEQIQPDRSTYHFARPLALGCFVIRLPHLPYSYAEMVYPLDFESTDLEFFTEDGTALVRTVHHLFAHRLEKGVVLRARVLGLWLNRQDDLNAAAAHYQQFANSEPPLTA